MAGDKQSYRRAMQKWEGLQASRALSVAADVGKTAIIVTSGEGVNDAGIEAEVAEKIFADEAERLAEAIRLRGGRPEILRSTYANMINVICSTEVASIYTIGHGTLSSIDTDDELPFDWRIASKVSDHLKRGVFVQRQCGVVGRNLNVPLGLFVASSFSSVYAAVGERLPTQLEEEHEVLFQPVQNSLYFGNDGVYIVASSEE